MQLTLFDEFWSLVRRIEVDIRELQPAPGGDLNLWWRWELEDAYEAILPLLFSISHQQPFYAPAGQTKTGGPFAAKNAHQALFYCLTVDASLLEFYELLDSPEYKELRAKAVDEVRRLDAVEQIPVAQAVLPRVGAAIWDDDYETKWVLPKIVQLSQSAYRRAESLPQVSTTNCVDRDSTLRLSSPELTQTQEDILDAMDDQPRRWTRIAERAGYSHDLVRRHSRFLQDAEFVKKTKKGFVRLTFEGTE